VQLAQVCSFQAAIDAEADRVAAAETTPLLHHTQSGTAEIEHDYATLGHLPTTHAHTADEAAAAATEQNGSAKEAAGDDETDDEGDDVEDIDEETEAVRVYSHLSYRDT
jgi:hypothetical protein